MSDQEKGQDSLPEGEVTRLLHEWKGGDNDALVAMIPLVYKQLKATARNHLYREAAPISLQATDLVNEVYLRLASHQRMAFTNRSGFFWFASTLIRRILVEHARARLAKKRGGGQALLTLQVFDGSDQGQHLDPETLIAIDEAIEKLKLVDQRQGKIVEMRFFGGLQVEEIAKTLSISGRTVMREWQTAKRFLAVELKSCKPDKSTTL